MLGAPAWLAASSASAASLVSPSSAYGGWAMPGGLPAYLYTADQDKLAAAEVPPNAPFGLRVNKDSTARGDREHSVMLGNDRLVLVGSNYGSWRIRQDEGGPKWLTDSDVDNATGWRFGGGVAFVHDAATRKQLATSAYTSGDATAREWGVGYGVTTSGGGATAAAISVRHTVAVLPGAEPAALIEVTVRNHNATAARNVTVAEAWDSGMVHQATGIGWGGWSSYTPESFPQFSNATVQSMFDRRKFTAGHYLSSFQRFSNRSAGVGVVQTRRFLGLSAEEKHFYEQTSNLPKRPSLKDKASMWDREPPALFLTRTDAGATAANTAFLNSARDFYHGGGSAAAGSASGTAAAAAADGTAPPVRVAPGGGRLAKELRWKETVPEGETALIALATVLVPANGSTTLKFVIGYLPPGACVRGPDASVVLDCATGDDEQPTPRHRASGDAAEDAAGDAEGLASIARKQWGPKLVKAQMPSQPWIERELAWHSFVLQATPTFDTYFNQSIIDQGTAYRYSAGFQGAIRDPLQHALPLIQSRPDLVRAVLKYSLMEQQRNVHAPPGTATDPVFVPDSVIGSGIIRPNTPQPDDFELYLLHLATEYVSATKDVGFLFEQVHAYGETSTHSVLSALLEAQNFTLTTVGTGPHGLLRLLSSDWDDGFKPPAAAEPVAESVLTSALAAYVLPRWAALLRSLPHADAGLEQAAAAAAEFGKGLKGAIFEQAWNGRWLRRAWLGPDDKWVGTSPAEASVNGTNVTLYSAQVGWALLAGVFDGHEAEEATQVDELHQQCRDGQGWALGFGYRCNNSADPRPGSGMWPAVNHVTLMGLAAVNRSEDAWTEFLRNSLHWQSSVYPQHWLGQWTSADTVDGAGSWGHAGWPGNWTWGFPALCTHRHAWPLVTFPFLAGLRFTPDGLDVKPALPPRLGAYSYESPLASIAFDGAGNYSGTYSGAGRLVRLRFDLASVAKASCFAEARAYTFGAGTSDEVALGQAQGRVGGLLELGLALPASGVRFNVAIHCPG
tara:strand:- start:269 stop:3316 length:3048 start_codon:yes stop_codon:yes gene_type:complete